MATATSRFFADNKEISIRTSVTYKDLDENSYTIPDQLSFTQNDPDPDAPVVVVNPGEKFEDGQHYHYLAQAVANVENGGTMGGDVTVSSRSDPSGDYAFENGPEGKLEGDVEIAPGTSASNEGHIDGNITIQSDGSYNGVSSFDNLEGGTVEGDIEVGVGATATNEGTITGDIHVKADGVVTGYGNGMFGPNDPITREQLAVMLWRYAGFQKADADLSRFVGTDKISNWAADAVTWVVENGIASGKGNGVLDPRGNATRVETAAMLMRYLELGK